MAATNPLQPPNPPPSTLRWVQVIELGYLGDGSADRSDLGVVCFHCGKSSQEKLLKCSKCRVASYCSKDCQIKDWKQGGHKAACDSYARVGPNMTIEKEKDQALARDSVLNRIRYYSCPYAVHKAQSLGRGFLFIQSTQTLATMALAKPKDSYGRPTTTRSLLIHFLTVGEFDSEVCRDDFELATVRTKLVEAVENYDEQKEMVVLTRFRCGQVALGLAPLVPDFAQCKQLGQMQFSEITAGALELQIDDM